MRGIQYTAAPAGSHNIRRGVLDHPPSRMMTAEWIAYPSNASIDALLPGETSVSSGAGNFSPLSRKRLVMG
ncbi:hypothetical protein ABID58_003847 [Bradyrhizobium sp. S3.2.6]